MSERQCEVVICLGTGGVGKTSVAAMLGLEACKQGKKALVITIDPARRLLDAFGIKEPTSHPIKVDSGQFFLRTTGELWAFMPDLAHEWLDFLTTAISDTGVRESIETNPFYRSMAHGLPGSLEIICTHILFRLLENDSYDVLILDTPPASNSISFIDVPNKLSHVLEHRFFKRFTEEKPSFLVKTAKKIAFYSSNVFRRTIETLMGSHFLSQVLQFSLTISDLYAPLLERADAMKKLLYAEQTKFVLVVRPDRVSLRDSVEFTQKLQEKGLKIHEVIVNQMLFKVPGGIEEEKAQLMSLQQQKIVQLIDDFLAQVRYEEQLVKRLKEIFLGCNFSFLFLVKNSEHDVLNALLQQYWKQKHESDGN